MDLEALRHAVQKKFGGGPGLTKTPTTSPVPMAPWDMASRAGRRGTGGTGMAGDGAGTPREIFREAVRSTGVVHGIDAAPPKVPEKLPEPLGGIAREAVKAYEAKKPIVQAQAKKAAGGLELMGEQTLQYQAAMTAEGIKLQGMQKSAAVEFDAAVGKAREYALEAHQRTQEGLQKIDEWGKAIYEGLDFTKAHDMLVAVESTVGSLREEDRQIAQKYGVDSAEYQQFQAGKSRALGIAQSTIQASHGKLRAEIGTNILQAKSTYLERGDMYESFQQQQDVEISAAMAKAKATYDLDISGRLIAIEQLKIAGWENLANWIIETPVFAMDAMDVVGFMGQLAVGQMERESAEGAAGAAASAQKKAGLFSMMGTIGGAIVGGPLGAGIGGAIGKVLGGIF